ncbi:hypothetical protein P3T35_000343 [Kitasatospora sp. GP30]|uniref:hypothetical protein n=1 Tax=Kitasatospora sp. GP30 TaxID=3035084 RepID=UPI000C70CECF|nr:hypothetical protein [Kitasatospora sp. GP30]MDH6138366.1 hypothetical protein [Kitasatospora sp. GP30]
MIDAQSDELVILVHGTFAGDKDRRDEGPRWWQRGSTTWEALTEVLPPGAVLPDEETGLFHWTGANAQSERLRGSADLLAVLLWLEEQGRSYHLVGHSHGGSVIWEALVSAQLLSETKKVPSSLRGPLGIAPSSLKSKRWVEWAQLRGLRSVTTVGTPFLHFLPRTTWLTSGWRSRHFTLKGPDVGFVRNMVGLSFYVPALAAMVGSVLGLPALTIGAVLEVFDVAVPFGLMGLAWGAALVLTAVLLGPANRLLFADALTHRAQTSRTVFERFADRWLGLWAPDDEAIGMLRGVAAPRRPDYRWLWHPAADREPWATPEGMGAPIPRVPVRIADPISNTGMVPHASLWKLTRTLGPLRAAFNRWIGPRISGAISRLLLHTVQGNDLPYTSLVYASPWPLPLDDLPPGLPETLAFRLTAHANARAAQLAPAIREILAQAALDGISLPQAAASRQRPRPDGALVHTGYFEDPELVRLIGLHIERHMARPPLKALDEPALLSWLDENAEAVQRRLAQFRSAVPE